MYENIKNGQRYVRLAKTRYVQVYVTTQRKISSQLRNLSMPVDSKRPCGSANRLLTIALKSISRNLLKNSTMPTVDTLASDLPHFRISWPGINRRVAICNSRKLLKMSTLPSSDNSFSIANINFEDFYIIDD